MTQRIPPLQHGSGSGEPLAFVTIAANLAQIDIDEELAGTS